MYYRYDVYICHSRRDYTIADNIVKALYAGGFSYYKEQASMETGSDFLQSIINAIDSSRLFLCVLSWNAYSSEFVIKELEYALQRNEITVLPVIVDNSPLPYKLRCLLSDVKIVYWNFSGSLDIADQIKKDVHRALGGENEQKLSTPPIFISYKRLDKDKVFLIVDSIRKETGIDCWIDLEGIESGDQFQNVIIDAIDNADTFVFMLSRNFIAPYRDERTGKIDLRKQTFPEKEVMYALRHGKRMVPVSIDGTTVYDCRWLDFNCSGLDSIDWSNESQRGKLLRNLMSWAGKSVVPASDSPKASTPIKPSFTKVATPECFDESRLSSMSISEELAYLRKWAEQGDANAQYKLALSYDDGKGVTQDKVLAVKWYRKAAEQGNAAAQCNLGYMYENGEGVAQDKVEAVKWYRKAAEQGDEIAKKRLNELGY